MEMTTDSVLVVLKQDEELIKLQQAVKREKGMILTGFHTKERYNNRGYTGQDIVSCILTGKVIEIQTGYNVRYKRQCRNLTVKGVDQCGNAIICVLSRISRKENIYMVVTIMPPCDKKRFGHLIA